MRLVVHPAGGHGDGQSLLRHHRRPADDALTDLDLRMAVLVRGQLPPHPSHRSVVVQSPWRGVRGCTDARHKAARHAP